MAETTGNGEISDGVNHGSMGAHVRTYDGVISMLKWGSVAVAIIAALVIWLIAT